MNTKVVVFDFDGTLTIDRKGSNCWVKVWEEINACEIDNELYHMFARGEIDNREWEKRIVVEFRKRNVNSAMCEKIASTLKRINGIENTFNFLYKNNVAIYILSGGIRQIVECVVGKELKYVNEIECQGFEFDKNGLVCDITSSPTNISDKSLFLNYLKDKHKIEGKQILFVGNSSNDEEAYKSGARTLCINPDKTDYENKKIWNNAIKECVDLSEIFNYL